jgi:hypothetical protein
MITYFFIAPQFESKSVIFLKITGIKYFHVD